jgi:hypothetical protein
MCDSQYYVKHEGGLNGLDLVDSNVKVNEMLRKYTSSKKFVLTVMRNCRNGTIVLSPMKKKGANHIDLDLEEEDPITH